jgi:hypothetical protein
MHTVQLILITADSAEDAFNEVSNKLNSGYNSEDGLSPTWSDWHHASPGETTSMAGRWAGQVFGEGKPDILCYDEDPELADSVIDRFVEYRLENILLNRSKAVDLKSLEHDPRAKSDFDMDLWATSKLAKLLDNEWTYESAIYDLEEWTGSLYYFGERIKAHPEKAWLVPVDFHH